MDIFQFIILQYIAHLLVDFSFQPDKKAKEKNKLGFQSKFLKWHILLAFMLSWTLSFQLYFFTGAILIALTHYLLDGFKRYINNHHILGKYAFFIDQALHLISITIIVYFYSRIFGIKLITDIFIITKYLVIFTAYLFSTKPANILIKEIFNIFDIKVTESNDLPNAGKLIGIIERWLVLAFIILNQFEAVGFLIASKSILRYKDDDTIKTEYVLIGTMLSFGIAIALGILINLI